MLSYDTLGYPNKGQWPDPETIRDRCYDFKNIFDEKKGKKLAFLTQNKAKF
jgi:hypothetical protein